LRVRHAEAGLGYVAVPRGQRPTSKQASARREVTDEEISSFWAERPVARRHITLEGQEIRELNLGAELGRLTT